MCSLCPGPHLAYLSVYNTFACNHSCQVICDVIRSAFCTPFQRHNMSPTSWFSVNRSFALSDSVLGKFSPKLWECCENVLIQEGVKIFPIGKGVNPGSWVIVFMSCPIWMTSALADIFGYLKHSPLCLVQKNTELRVSKHNLVRENGLVSKHSFCKVGTLLVSLLTGVKFLTSLVLTFLF